MELIQSQIQRLSQQQLQSVELLQMSAQELETYLRDLSQENPVVELEESSSAPVQDSPREEELLRREADPPVVIDAQFTEESDDAGSAE